MDSVPILCLSTRMKIIVHYLLERPVAPTKVVTIVRLELTAAVLSVKISMLLKSNCY